jgi:hypothetical protein
MSKARIMEEENRALKKKNKWVETRCKKLVQIVAKNEVEGVKKALEIRTKERDLFKTEFEKGKEDN